MKKILPIIFSLFLTVGLTAQSIPDFTITDSHGTEFSLHEQLASGQAILLDFMASWCGPCQASTFELNNFYVTNGAGLENLNVFSITIEDDDDAEVLNNLNWGGTFPKFPYAAENPGIFDYYNTTLGLGSGGIPFFILICPNTDDPGESTIIRSDTGYNSSMFNISFQLQLNNCATATLSNNEITTLQAINLFPNPAKDAVNLEFATDQSIDAQILIHNAMGQLVKSITSQKYQAGEHLVEIDTNELTNGLYVLTLETEDGQKVLKFNVVK